MDKFSRHFASIGMLLITLWIAVTAVLVVVFGERVDSTLVLAGQLFMLALVCAIATCICHLLESHCTWSTDSRE